MAADLATGRRRKIGASIMDWDKLRIFHAVAEAGSFTHAGDLLNLSQSAVSRQISALEDSLKLPLFHRHARGLVLTEQGDMLYRTAHEVFGKLAMVEAHLTETKDRPKGPLKVTTMVSFGATWLAPRIHQFLDQYPDVQIQLLLDDRELDLSMREADVAIRFKAPRQADLIQRHLMTVHLHAYASNDYVERFGMPKDLDALDDHRIITYGERGRAPLPEADWLIRVGREGMGPRKTTLSINNVYGIKNAILSGAGIGALPDVMAYGEDTLVPILPDLEGPEFDAYFVYAEEMRASKRIAIFREFLLRNVAESHF